MKLRVGVIGTGFGAEVQIPAFLAHPRVEVVAIASGTPGRAREVAGRFEIPHAFDDYRAMVATAELDLVSITSPPDTHHPATLAALARRRHVLCEKPMALNAAQAEEMLREAERQGVTHVIDHELRFNPNRRKIKRLIEERFIGAPRHALITVVGTGRADATRPWTWWSDARRGGGILGAQGSHQIDLLRYFLGDVAAISGTTETYVKERPDPAASGRRAVTSDDFTSFSLRFASGAVGIVVNSAVGAHGVGPRTEIWGEEGTLILDQEERLWGARRGESLREITEPETLEAPPGMNYSSLWGLSFIRLAAHVVNAILEEAPVAPTATFADGLQVQRVLDTVRATAGRQARLENAATRTSPARKRTNGRTRSADPGR